MKHENTSIVARPRVMLIPNTISWILGTWAKEIQKWNSDRYDFVIFPFGEIREDAALFTDLLNDVDIVHCLSQTIYPSVREAVLLRGFDHLRLISSIHHIVKFSQVEDCVNADKVMVVCRQFEEELLAHHIERDKLYLVYNGVDIALFNPGDKIQARSQFGIPQDAFTIGFSANASSDHDGRKGVDILKAVLAQLAVTNTNLHVIMTGPGWEEIVKTYRGSSIKFHYYPYLPLEKMPQYYRSLDIYLVTARVEGGPVPPMEAMACGTAVITTPVGTMLDFVQHGVNGILTPVGDVRAAVDAVNRLYTDSEQRENLARAGRETIQKNLQWKHTVRKIDGLYGMSLTCPGHDLQAWKFPKFDSLNDELIQKDEQRWKSRYNLEKNTWGKFFSKLFNGKRTARKVVK